MTKKKKKRTKCWRRAVRFTRLSFKVPKLIVQIKERATSRTKATVTHSSFKAALFKASLYEPPNCVIGEKAHSLHNASFIPLCIASMTTTDYTCTRQYFPFLLLICLVRPRWFVFSWHNVYIECILWYTS